jgi:hypothetical protein
MTLVRSTFVEQFVQVSFVELPSDVCRTFILRLVVLLSYALCVVILRFVVLRHAPCLLVFFRPTIMRLIILRFVVLCPTILLSCVLRFCHFAFSSNICLTSVQPSSDLRLTFV